MYFRLRTWL